SLDGVLRYVPVSALHDGTQYVLDRFASVLVTAPAAELPRLKLSGIQAAGFGVTRQIPFHLALHAVREELNGIIRTCREERGVMPGSIWLDDAFTAESLRQALAGHDSVVHIASHFAFRAAQEASSYLLLGDGTKLSLNDLVQMRFEGLELMVLSAC